MQDKLQELTDKLYNEGLSKGKQEGEEILAKARKQAEEIIAKANSDADSIRAAARREAEELKTKVTGDVRMAALQSITATRQSIEKLILTEMTDKETSSALSSAGYVKKLIEAVAKSFNPAGQDPADIALVLPESMKKELEPFVKNLTAKQPFSRQQLAVTDPEEFLESILSYMIRQKMIIENKEENRTVYRLK